jgi:hypothetical protein
MTNEERDIISRFVARVGGAPQGGAFAGSPGAPPAALPPIDPEADRFIAEQFQQHPEARYRITQMAFVQEAALVEAQNRIKRLEWELDQARQQAAQAGQQRGGGGGFFSNLFGGGGRQAGPNQGGAQYGQPGGPGGQPQYAPPPPQYAPPPPQYPPNYNPAMFRSGGSGFLGSALGTAAGVAGGMVAANALMDLFGGHHQGYGGMGGLGGAGFGPSETIINNNYGSDPGAGGADPWANISSDPNADPGAGGGDPWSGAENQGGGVQDNPFDQGGGGGGDAGGWDDLSGGGGGGWDDTSNC